MSTVIEKLRKRVSGEEFDYQTLMDSLAGYAAPRDKISLLLRQGAIVRIKKGLYIFGDTFRRKPICHALLANLIYGPSYVSLDYALQYHGLIPERVTVVTSVTTGRSRCFYTPVGRFDYNRIPLHAFRTGMDMVELSAGCSFLVAIAEKALADKLLCERGSGIRSLFEMQRHLEEELRIDHLELSRLNPDRLDEIVACCGNVRVTLLASLVRQLQKG